MNYRIKKIYNGEKDVFYPQYKYKFWFIWYYFEDYGTISFSTYDEADKFIKNEIKTKEIKVEYYYVKTRKDKIKDILK